MAGIDKAFHVDLTYPDICMATGQNRQAAYSQAERHAVEFGTAAQVAIYVAKHGRPLVRMLLMDALLGDATLRELMEEYYRGLDARGKKLCPQLRRKLAEQAARNCGETADDDPPEAGRLAGKIARRRRRK